MVSLLGDIPLERDLVQSQSRDRIVAVPVAAIFVPWALLDQLRDELRRKSNE